MIPFEQLTHDKQKIGGGKAAALARMTQAGYPVPAGFVIPPKDFLNGKLSDSAWKEVQVGLTTLRNGNGTLPLAIRSSALSEDSAQASFAGEFETVLNVMTDDEIYEAIHAVQDSRENARARAYSAARGLDSQHQMAVIVQKMVAAEFSGVLFTADPISGSHTKMVGNFVRGLGEALVSGEADGESFTLERPFGKYQGPRAFKRYGRRLHKLAHKLTETFEQPQDIEWAVADGKLYLLQSRPITTLQAYNSVTGEWNDSLRGDFLWTNTNLGEALPDVMTPATWSVFQMHFAETFPFRLPGNHPVGGNIGGRFYLNLSLFASLVAAMGFDPRKLLASDETFGRIPDGVEIPLVPFSAVHIIRHIVPMAVKAQLRVRRNQKEISAYLAQALETAVKFQQKISTLTTAQALSEFWHNELEPQTGWAFRMVQASMSRLQNQSGKLRKTLTKLVGEEDAAILLSSANRDGSNLESLGPVLNLTKVANDEVSREAYLARYGHRGPHEAEISTPRPAEDSAWIDDQLAQLGENRVDVVALLAKQASKYERAWQKLAMQYPRRAKSLQKRLADHARASRVREQTRSEATRLLGVIRSFYLQAGKLTGLENAIFFLSLEELMALLAGDETAVSHISPRQEAYKRFCALPPYPPIINGRFNPHAWAADPDKCRDIFDAHQDLPAFQNLSGQITGLPGSAGIAEGIVRHIKTLDDSHQLQPGEILLTSSTNIGWTPIFPRAAAIITDIGAPLSHAAIVARELGIPAVVGCGNATARLKTGDFVRVNGGAGVIEMRDWRTIQSPTSNL